MTIKYFTTSSWCGFLMLIMTSMSAHSGSAFMEGSFFNAKKVFDWCVSGKQADKNMCITYLAGSFDTYRTRGLTSNNFCLPKNTSGNLLKETFVRYGKI